MSSSVQRKLPQILLGVAIAAFLVLAYQQYDLSARSARSRMEHDIERLENAIDGRLHAFDDTLRGAGEFVTAQKLDSELWHRYVTSLHLEQKWPSPYGFGYASYFTEENRPRRLRMTPRGKRFDYMVIEQIEPAEPLLALKGYDIGTDLMARAAAERAKETRASALSGKLTLPDDPASHGFMMFYPVFREDDFQGWVFGRFREADLLKGFDAPTLSKIRLQIYDGPEMTREALFYDSSGNLSDWQRPPQTPKTLVRGFQAAGRAWTLNMTPLTDGSELPVNRPREIPPAMVFCLLMMVAAAFWIWAGSRAGILAEHLLTGMRRREAAFTMGPYGIVLADATQPDLPVIYVNRAFERITGYSAQEVVGKNSRYLQGSDRDQKGLQEIRRALREQRDCRVLLRNYRKDGTPFWNDLYLSPVRNDMGRVVQYVAIQQDVTEREQTARRLATEGAIIRALAESPSLFEAAPRILQAICEGQEWDMGTFWRLEPRQGILHCVDQWHSPDLDLHDFGNFIRDTTFTRDAGVPGHIWAKAEQVWLPDVTKDSRFPEAALASQAGLVSACGFPIASHRGLLGVLVFYSRRIWPLSKNLLLLMVGTGAQISQFMEREKIEIEQKELTILERGLAEFMGEGLLAMDREGYCIYTNVTAGRMLGFTPRTLLGQNVHELLHPATPAGWPMGKPAACPPGTCPLLLSLQSTRPVHVDDHSAAFRRKDGDPLPVAYTTSPIIDRDIIQGVVVTFVDASKRRAAEEEIRRQLAQKESELANIQKILVETREFNNQPNPSDLLLEKIRKLLG